RQEEEEGVLPDWSAQRRAELPLVEVEGWVLAPVGLLRPRGQSLVLVIQVRGSMEIVRAGLGDDVDEPGSRAPELGVGAVGHDDHLLNRVQVECERGTLASALLAEEGIVE